MITLPLLAGVAVIAAWYRHEHRNGVTTIHQLVNGVKK
jgi:hypothetical protein